LLRYLWYAQEAAPVIGVVPVQVLVADGPAHRGLAYLTRPGDQGHLAVSAHVIQQDRGVQTQAFGHGTIIALVAK
jgi:hypothetical protein